MNRNAATVPRNPAWEETATEHGLARYLPLAERVDKTALCLSGGGFRAALFHLGALRRLNELGVLSRVDTITAVSGGSILAAHLAERVPEWPKPGGVVDDWDARVAEPFRAFTARNLRTRAILHRVWRPFDVSGAVKGLEAEYARHVTRRRLSELPDHPRYVFSATDMPFGAQWTFEKEWYGSPEAGRGAPPPDFPVARAVAASSCFPPVFHPLPLRLKPGDLDGGRAAAHDDYAGAIRRLWLTDGGNVDNMGLEPVWMDHRRVLVSDGGATFDYQARSRFFNRFLRYLDIYGHQTGHLRKRWLIASFITGVMEGAYWGIGGKTRHYGKNAPHGYGDRVVDERIAEVRTDMDAFTDAERAVIENHGYLMADAAVRRHLPALVSVKDAPLAPPHPDALDDEYVHAHLAESHKRRKLGRW